MGAGPDAVIAVTNQKGGVGKTTLAVNLGAGLARLGKRVLLIDLDIQGSASAILGADESHGGVAQCLLENRGLAAAVVETCQPGLHLVPAGPRMALVDLHLASALGRERVLSRSLRDSQFTDYDVVLLDTAPYLGLVTINALVVATHLLVPVSCEYLPMLGLKLLRETVDSLGDQLGAHPDLLGYVLTMVDRRERITVEVESLLRQTFQEQVFRQVIRVNTHHKASPSHKQTIYDYEGASGRGRQDFDGLCHEVLTRLTPA